MKQLPLVPLLMSACFAATLLGCENEGPAEQAGERIDNTVEKAGDKLEDTGERARDAGSR